MKLTDAEIEEIATRPTSAVGRRKQELAIEVKELRAANTRLCTLVEHLYHDPAKCGVRALLKQDEERADEIDRLKGENTRLQEEAALYKQRYQEKAAESQRWAAKAGAHAAENTPRRPAFDGELLGEGNPDPDKCQCGEADLLPQWAGIRINGRCHDRQICRPSAHSGGSNPIECHPDGPWSTSDNAAIRKPEWPPAVGTIPDLERLEQPPLREIPAMEDDE